MNKPKSRAIYMAELRKKQKSIQERGLDYMSIYPTPEFVKPNPTRYDVKDSQTGRIVTLDGFNFGSFSVVTDRLYDEVINKGISESALKLIFYIQRNIGKDEPVFYNTNLMSLSIEDIMRECKLSKPTAYKALTAVIDFHVLYKTEVKNKYVVNHKYIYRFSPVKFVETQLRYKDRYEVTVENNTIIVNVKNYELKETGTL